MTSDPRLHSAAPRIKIGPEGVRAGVFPALSQAGPMAFLQREKFAVRH